MGAALLLALALAGGGRFERVNSRTEQGRSDRGLMGTAGTPYQYAFFEVAPPTGLGMPAECSGGGVEGVLDGGQTMVAMTFTRASAAWCTKEDYSLVQLSAGQPRVMPGRPGAPMGYLNEQSGQNDLLYSNDLSQAAWTKSASMSCTLTATGPDNVANSASTCTANAATQTVTQAVVRASSANSTSVYVRRRTGSGVVEVLDVSGSYQDITSSLSMAWKRVACRDVEGCMGGRCVVVPSLCATSANPSVGFRIQTNGDAIDIGLAQNEATLRPSSPISTSATAASRAADSMYIDVPAFVMASLRIGFVGTTHNNNEYALMLSNGSGAPFITLYSATPPAEWDVNMACLVSTGGSALGPSMTPPGGVTQFSCAIAPGASSGCINGRCNSLGGASVPSVNRIYVGGAWTGATDKFAGVLSSVCVDTGQGCAATDVAPTSAGHIAWLGDSITNGSTTSHPIYPTNELYRLEGQYNSRAVMNWGTPGIGVAQAYSDWGTIKTLGYRSLVVLIGVNDLRTGTSAATIWSTYATILNEAKALGWSVTPVYVLPWANWAEWTAGKQTQTDELNADMQAWCTANGSTCVDTSSLGTGSPLALQAGYDFGDGLHLNGAGATALAALVAGANP